MVGGAHRLRSSSQTGRGARRTRGDPCLDECNRARSAPQAGGGWQRFDRLPEVRPDRAAAAPVPDRVAGRPATPTSASGTRRLGGPRVQVRDNRAGHGSSGVLDTSPWPPSSLRESSPGYATRGEHDDDARQPRSSGCWFLRTTATAQFVQQGNKLVGRNAVGSAEQGKSVAISADGNTVAIGGWLDNARNGATWVFTRSGGVWSQQGSKLVGSGRRRCSLAGVGRWRSRRTAIP